MMFNGIIFRFKWTVRVFGFIVLIALGIANIVSFLNMPISLCQCEGLQTIDRRLPPVNANGGLFNLAAFRNPAYTVYCMSGISCLLGLYTGRSPLVCD